MRVWNANGDRGPSGCANGSVSLASHRYTATKAEAWWGKPLGSGDLMACDIPQVMRWLFPPNLCRCPNGRHSLL